MAMLKNKKKSEFERQIAIAQSGVYWVSGFKIKHESARINSVLNEFGGLVERWAKKYENDK